VLSDPSDPPAGRERECNGAKLQKLNDEVFADNAKYDPDLKLDWAVSSKGQEYFQKLVNNPDHICFVAELVQN